MEVTAVHHRDDPILLGSPPMKPPRFHFGLPFRAATIWQNLETAGVTDVVGAWQHVSQLMTVVALKQRYDGHAKRAALVAAAHSYMARIVVVVDEDVDPSNLNDVMWAVATRCEPSEQLDIVRNAWSSALDPRIPAAAKERGITCAFQGDHRGLPPVSLDRQVSADLGAVARGGARDRGEVGGNVEVRALNPRSVILRRPRKAWSCPGRRKSDARGPRRMNGPDVRAVALRGSPENGLAPQGDDEATSVNSRTVSPAPAAPSLPSRR